MRNHINIINIRPSRAAATVARRWMFLIAVSVLVCSAAEATEIVPSVGLTRSIDGDDTKSLVGLALRSPLLPVVLQSEIAVGYRQEEYFGGDLKTKMWPVTVSALLTPLPVLHADAGAGWYNTTLDYKDPLLKDETKQKFGVHAGGGLRMPFTPVTALDLTGRYVWLQKQESRLVPQKFDPNFWTMSLGLAIKL